MCAHKYAACFQYEGEAQPGAGDRQPEVCRAGRALSVSRAPRLFFVLAGLILVLAGAAAGQSPTLISLDQAIDLALAHNHALKATRTLILQNQAQEITANLRPNPSLGADSQFIPISARRIFPPTISILPSNSTSESDTCLSVATNGSAGYRLPAIKPRLLARR